MDCNVSSLYTLYDEVDKSVTAQLHSGLSIGDIRGELHRLHVGLMNDVRKEIFNAQAEIKQLIASFHNSGDLTHFDTPIDGGVTSVSNYDVRFSAWSDRGCNGRQLDTRFHPWERSPAGPSPEDKTATPKSRPSGLSITSVDAPPYAGPKPRAVSVGSARSQNSSGTSGCASRPSHIAELLRSNPKLNTSMRQAIWTPKRASVRTSGSDTTSQGARVSVIHSFVEMLRSMDLADWVDLVIAIAILSNGIVIGLQTDFMAVRRTERTPKVYTYFEYIFCIIFGTELVLRVWTHGWLLYTGPGWHWNVFDTVLVLVQGADVVTDTIFTMFISTQDSFALTNTGFVRLLRILRLMRILRLVRLLQFLGDLNIVTAAIAGSLKNLLGTVMMLLLCAYVCGIVFCQICTAHRIDYYTRNEGVDESEVVDEIVAMEYWWGSLPRSILSLWESILGGVDWDSCISPLNTIWFVYGLIFACYIAFISLAMMNVITGIIVDSAIKQAERMQNFNFCDYMRFTLGRSSVDGEGNITRWSFEEIMCHPETIDYMKKLGIEVSDARALFAFLDNNNAQTIDLEELVNGLVRLRSGAKFLDVMVVLKELAKYRKEVEESVRCVGKTAQSRGQLQYSRSYLEHRHEEEEMHAAFSALKPTSGLASGSLSQVAPSQGLRANGSEKNHETSALETNAVQMEFFDELEATVEEASSCLLIGGGFVPVAAGQPWVLRADKPSF